jgi:hypothetical protein
MHEGWLLISIMTLAAVSFFLFTITLFCFSYVWIFMPLIGLISIVDGNLVVEAISITNEWPQSVNGISLIVSFC